MTRSKVNARAMEKRISSAGVSEEFVGRRSFSRVEKEKQKIFEVDFTIKEKRTLVRKGPFLEMLIRTGAPEKERI